MQSSSTALEWLEIIVGLGCMVYPLYWLIFKVDSYSRVLTESPGLGLFMFMLFVVGAYTTQKAAAKLEAKSRKKP